MSGEQPPENGTTGVRIEFNAAVWMTISAFTAVAWYNVAQLNVSIFMTFKKRRGLYFWSLLISGYGCIFHSIGFLLKLFQLTTNNYLSCTIITIGWWPMVTGQSLVLYSRLHLVVKEQRILRGVLIMIIWNAVTLHIPTTVFTFGSSSPAWEDFLPGFIVMEKVQMTIFCLQEFIISGIYMWATARLLKPVYRRRTRSVMQQLIWINVFIVIMDISLLVLEYLGNYHIETSLKPMVYSIKLTLEFSVLNQLMRLANSSNAYNTSVRDNDSENEGRKKRRRPFRYVTKLLPHHAPFHDEKNSDVVSPRSAVPRGTPASGQVNNTSLGSERGNSLAYINSHDSFSPNFGSHKRRPSGQRPCLAVDIGRARQSSSASTVINNPAAFTTEKRPSRDPYYMEGLTPITATPITAVPQVESRFPGLNDRSTFPKPKPNLAYINTARANSPGPSPDVSPTTTAHAHERNHTLTANQPGTPGSRTSRFSALLNIPHRLANSHHGPGDDEAPSPTAVSPPDPDLLISRRPSVADWAGYRSEGDSTSRSSSEMRLDPMDKIKRSTRVLEANYNARQSEVVRGGEDADGEVSEGEMPIVDDDILSDPEEGSELRGWSRERELESAEAVAAVKRSVEKRKSVTFQPAGQNVELQDTWGKDNNSAHVKGGGVGKAF